jgi:hypothetical protein
LFLSLSLFRARAVFLFFHLSHTPTHTPKQQAKVEEPVKMVDDKIDHLRIELEDKLAFLANKTAVMKELAEAKVLGVMNVTDGLKAQVEAKVEGAVDKLASIKN